ncbi:helix-turn-helix domain-containing protein [Hyphomicrobium sp.]|jgi:AraC-like DNA-binding protein|uniref:helix-turn-helix domain-containing protein n=1 Tax=Hyphomicrobium sp. TaxID=82 RepID=UPI002CCFE3C8|nr:helix-turn-helix domain-containing protein [Hyphomicrobium sp.]HVZ03810.1 helix-turn-helix domain-containing protein [Hyphomicrobium sp.]
MISDSSETAATHCNLIDWDSRYGPEINAFGSFKELVCSAFMPWSLQPLTDTFDGRIESVSGERWAVGRIRSSPLVARKTLADIANSREECIYGDFILKGQLEIERDGKTTIARAGDLALYRSYHPLAMTRLSEDECDNFVFMVPKERLCAPSEGEFQDDVLSSQSLLYPPLRSCLHLLMRSLGAASAEELEALFDACVQILRLSLRMRSTSRKADWFGNPKFRELVEFIQQNIDSPDLSPHFSAKHLGISVRYVHKLFKQAGLTFSSYVMSQRLHKIRHDLLAHSPSRLPSISDLAYKWGFRELSTFHRAFKAQFGCTPRQLAVRSDIHQK